MAERCSAPSDGDGDDTNAQRAKRRRAAPNPSTQAIDAADLRLLESLFAHDVDGVPSDDDTPRMELRDFQFLARGHKGVVYVANYSCAGRTGRVAIKICRDGGARQEERWLRRCNELDIGASLVSAEVDCVVMEYVEGPSIGEALEGAVPPSVLFKALRDLLGQCARLDERGIDKREMNRCQKHVIVSREGRSTLLDFERCQESAKPCNVTGLAQYLTQAWAVGKLRGAGASVDVDAVRAACKDHKKGPSRGTAAAVERALGLGIGKTWRSETDPATGRTVFTNGLERRDTWPKPPPSPPRPPRLPSPPQSDGEGGVLPSKAQLEELYEAWADEDPFVM